MPYGLYLSAAGADVQRQRIEVMANNLANVDTPGFKRELTIVRARAAESIERGLTSPGAGGIDDVGGGVLLERTATDHSLGTLKRTDARTDFALPGEGYFAVEKNGEERLTRAGNFLVNVKGELVTQQGYRVLSDTGQAITLTDPNWYVDGAGIVRQNGSEAALKLVKAPPGDLVKDGENLFAPLDKPVPLRLEERQVATGFLEISNVSPMVQMMELIEATRGYEANIRMIQNHDTVLGTLVGRMLRSQ